MPRHVVVDGSNLATEGRAMPSLKQLNEAVTAYIADHPNDLITVVVDATFGHRIDQREVKEFDAAVENNEIVAPPAGAVGRGDAFVLTIANKVNAIVLSNDSYQEFHGQYDWLFDEGRLVGGKPVPHIGWVFVPRVPVRGPLSRKAVRDAKRRDGDGATGRGGRSKASKAANQPMPVPSAPPPALAKAASKGDGGGRKGKEKAASEPAATAAPAASAAAALAPKSEAGSDGGRGASHHLNDLLSFLGFVEQHPVGSTLSAVVESYSSHGAYVKIGDVSGYVPLRLMSEPPPRSAREVMAIGEAVTLVVAAFNGARRGIDLGVPGMVPVVAPVPSGRKRGSKKAQAALAAAEAETASEAAAALPVVTVKAPRGSKKAPAAEVAPKAAPAAKRGKKAVPEPPAAVSSPPAAGGRKRGAKKAAAAEPAVPASAAPAPTPAVPAPAKAKGGRAKKAPATAVTPPAAPAAAAAPEAAPAPSGRRRRSRS
jgi:hypothetical protein